MGFIKLAEPVTLKSSALAYRGHSCLVRLSTVYMTPSYRKLEMHVELYYVQSLTNQLLVATTQLNLMLYIYIFEWRCIS